MNEQLGRLFQVSERQRGLVAVWQMRRLGVAEDQIKVVTRRLRQVHRGVYARGDLDEMGWLHAAVLALGPGAALSHASALLVLGLRLDIPDVIHVSVPRGGGRAERDGIVVHRSRAIDRWRAHGIPVTSPTQSLRDARLPPAELYHAIDLAETRNYPLTLPANDVVRLQQATHGRTKSVAEAAFVLLCHGHDIAPPRINQRLNGFEADFHWPRQRLVVEVDGWEFHKERPQFEEDRRRGLVHNARGYTVTRVSANQVAHDPALVAAAIAEQLSARTVPSSKRRAKTPK